MAIARIAAWTRRRLAAGRLCLLALVALASASGAIVPSRVQAQAFCPANVAPGSRCDVASSAAGSIDAGSAPGTALPSTRLGNPIDLVTGTKLQAENDLAIDGAPLGFTRFYSSANADANVGLGQGWRHTFLVRLFAGPEGGRVIDDSTGRRVRFAPPSADAPGVFPALSASDGQVVLQGDGAHVWVVPDGRRVRFHGPLPVRIDWPDARFLSLAYRGGRLATVTDETGRALGFEYTLGIGLPGFDPVEFGSLPGHLAALVLPDGSRVEYDYDNRRNLTRSRFADDTARVYRYEDPLWRNHLTGLVERTGISFATWRYDDGGRAISSERADGIERVTLRIDAPDAVGEVGTTIVTNADGADSTWTWRRDPRTGAGLLLEATGPGCATCPPTRRRYGYDADARLVRDARLGDDGNEVSVRTYRHDDRSRLVRIDETVFGADGTARTRTIELREHDGDSHRVASRTLPSVDADGAHTIRTEHDAAGLPVRIVERGRSPVFELASDSPEPVGFEPIERSVSFAHEAGLLVAIDGPRDDVDDVTRLERDEAGRVIRILPPASPAISIGDHDAFGRPSTLRVGGRSPYRLERDGQGRVVRVTAGGESIGYGHDAEGRLVSITDTDGRTTLLAHDAAGRLASVTDDLGRMTTLVRDAESRIVERTAYGTDGTLLRSLAYVFDADGRVRRSIETTTDAEGRARTPRTLEHGRGANGLLRTLTDLDTGATSSIDVDIVFRIATLVAPDGATTRIGFDAVGRDVSLTDARDNVTRTPVDDFGRRVMLDGPDTGRTLVSLDAAGNPLTSRHESGTIIEYVHDAANRVVVRTTTDTVARWRWDAAAGTLVEARTDSVAPDSGAATVRTLERFAHGADARLLSHERVIGGHTFVTRYTRDARGRVVEERLPDGRTLVHHYHDAGPDRGALRAITVRGRYGLSRRTLVAEIDTDARDGRTGYLSAGGERTGRRFAPNGELVELALTDAVRLEYEFDERGRIVGIAENGATHRYGYDGSRLAFAGTPRGETTWTFDAVGNRTTQRRHAADGRLVEDERYAYGARGEGNRLLGTTDTVTARTSDYRYDGATGAPSSIGALTYTHDADRRPVEVRRDGELVARYAYNAFGERVRKAVYAGNGTPPHITYFLYGDRALTAEIDEAGTILRRYVYLDGHRPVAMLSGDALYGIHGDHLGTPRAMTDEHGRTVWRADYAPYGEATVVLEDVALPLRLPGQYADAETGTHYNYFRDYDPGTGRYLTSDPIGLAGGVNTYGYVDGDPLRAIDPLGLYEIPAPGTALHQALARAGLIAALDGPAPFGDAVAASMLLVHFIDRGVAGLTEALLGKTDFTEEYRALFQQIRRFDNTYGSHSSPLWTPDIDDVQRLVRDLYDAQLNYLARCALPGTVVDETLRGEALGAVEFTESLVADLDRERSPMEGWLRDEFDHYRANGGELDSLAEWIGQGMPGSRVALVNRGLDPVWLKTHNTQIGLFVKGREISGAHNENSFNENLALVGGTVVQREQVAPGVYQLTYRVPRLQRDGTPAEPPAFTADSFEKTVYDSSVYSDDDIVELSLRAADQATFAPGETQASTLVDGVPFRIYKNPTTGEITNVHVARP